MGRKRSCSPEARVTSHGSSGAKFDVFLSFRGPDTRSNFTDFLYHALLDKGIHVFIDKKGIDIGEEIGPEIFQAIDNSKICIPIFSRGYASSSWCLRELEHMMQRRKTSELEVLPIFYDVEPSDVKLETGVYRDALTLHKEKRGAETLQRWEEMLKEVARIKGWDTKNVNHGELARLIARKVLVKLKVSCVHISDHLVGMDKSVNEVVDLLNVESKDIKLIGIWGMGGIGKTTLAKVVYQELSAKFDSCSFISNIREASRGSDLLNVQRQLVFDILGDVGFGLSSIDHGINIIKDRFNKKKILIFLDDVDHRSQLMALAGNAQWFGSGSRIVVTTRDKSVVSGFHDEFEVCRIFEAKKLNNLDAIKLFSKHAFRRNSPPNDALFNLAEKVTAKSGGLPLAIEVMGSFLYGKKEAVWEATLKKMGHCPHKDVKEKLMLSYEALDHQQKQIFLDIACFLAGRNKRDPFYMWDDCGFFPDEGIEVLQLMSLVKIDEDGNLWMHDQLKDLGQSIVYQENCKDPRKGSRLWQEGESSADVIQQKKGTETVAATIYKDYSDNSVLRSQDFTEMPNIRFLRVYGRSLSGDFEYRFSKLRWLYWWRCPKDFQATNFCPRNLVVLNLSGSGIDEHWGGWTQLKVATRLKVLDLSYCYELKETPYLSTYLSLEILNLQSCMSLLRIDCSIGHLKCLKHLNLSGCHRLQMLPVELGSLEALTELLITGNNISIREVPSSIGALINLERLVICGAINLTKLPDSIGMLKGLVELDISKSGILELPNTIANLKSLKLLTINESHMQKLPEGIGMLEALTKLLICYNGFPRSISEVPSSIGALINLKCLVISGAINLTRLPDSIGMLEDLVELDISKTGIVELPNTIANLKCLKVLKINESHMQKLPEGIEMLEALTEPVIDNNGSPKSISEVPSSIGALVNQKRLVVCGAVNLTRLPDSIGMLESLVELDISKTGIVELPNAIANLKSLKVLKINKSHMQKLPEEIGMLEALTELLMDNSHSLGSISEVPSSIGALINLQRLVVCGAVNLTRLPDSIGMLKSLVELDISKTGIVELPNAIANLKSLKVLKINESHMQKLPEEIGMLEALTEPVIDNNGSPKSISEVPSSIGALVNQKRLVVCGAVNLTRLPDSIGMLESLVELDISKTGIVELPNAIANLKSLKVLKINKSHMQKLPEEIGMLEALTELLMDNSHSLGSISEVPSSIGALINLQRLVVCGAVNLTRLPDSIGMLKSLVELDISKTGIVELPNAIANLKSLKVLKINESHMQKLPEEIGMLEALTEPVIDNNGSPKSISEVPSSIGALVNQKRLVVCGAVNLTRLPDSIGMLESLVELDISKTGIVELPNAIANLKSLKVLKINKSHMQKLPEEIGMLEALTELLMDNSHSLGSISEVPSSIGALINLQRLVVCGAVNLTRLPDSIGMLKSLVELDISKTGIVELPNAIANLKSLKVLKINESHMQKLPEEIGMLEALTEPVIDNNGSPKSISEVPSSIGALVNQKRLVVCGAVNLTRLPDSIGMLESLVELDISKTGIVELPNAIANLKSLKVLKINKSHMQKLPEEIGMLEALTELLMDNSHSLGSISEVPSSIGALINLQRLVVCGAVNLTRLPDSIGMLKSLVELDISKTGIVELPNAIANLKSLKVLKINESHMQKLPEEIGMLEALTELLMDNSHFPGSIREVPSSIGALINLQRLVVCGAVNLTRLPDSIGMLESLVELDISKTGIVELPNAIANLKSLKVLKINESHMQKLPEEIGMLEALTELLMDNSHSLGSISEVSSSIGALINLQRLVVCGAVNLTRLPDSIGMLKSLVELDISKTGIVELPNAIANLKSLKVLKINESHMQKLPEEIGMLEALTELLMDNSHFPGSIREVPSSIGALINLQRLVVCGAVNLTRLPDSIGMLKSLVELDVSKTGIVELPNAIVNLKSLEVLAINKSHMPKLPEEIGKLEALTKLLIVNSHFLGSINEVPSSIGALQNLNCLVLCGSIKLTTLPESIGMLKGLDKLDVSETGITELPNTIVKLKSLRVLKMNRSYMQKLPEAIGMLEKLEKIHGKGCTQLKMIPDDIVRLPLFKILNLTETRVENVPKLPKTLVNLCLSSNATEKAPEISNLVNLSNLELRFTSSRYIGVFPSKTTYSKRCMLVLTSITTVSSYLGCFHCLEELRITDCCNLPQIEQLPCTLRKLFVGHCDLLEAVDLSDLSEFQNLEHLRLECCPKLGEVHGLDRLESLKSLYITFCGSLLCLPDLSIWKKLEEWDVDALTTSSAKGKQVARSDDLPL